MTQERRFGIALFVLAMGNGMLAFGNYVAGGEMSLIAFEGFAAVVLAGLAWSFVYGGSEFSEEKMSQRLVTYLTLFVAAVGVLLAIAGFAIAVLL